MGKKVAAANTLFNVASGSISVGDYTIFGQNVMVLTGRHLFKQGQRAGAELFSKTDSWGGVNWRCPPSVSTYTLEVVAGLPRVQLFLAG